MSSSRNSVETLSRSGDVELRREHGVLVLRNRGQGCMSDAARLRVFGETHSAHLTGRVLFAGLGLGLHLETILQNPLVSSVTVVEKFIDVVRVWRESPRYNEGVTVHVCDFWDFHGTFDSAWLDIFSSPPSATERRAVFEKARTLCAGPLVVWPEGLVWAA